MDSKLIVEELGKQEQNIAQQQGLLLLQQQQQEQEGQWLQEQGGQVLLRLEDISPKWAGRLKGELPTFMSLTWFKWYFELKRTSKCVVGEAYGYSSSYIHNCSECDEIGWKFMYYFTIKSNKKLEENKNRFVNHWNEQHR
jgi:hypothetical protein